MTAWLSEPAVSKTFSAVGCQTTRPTRRWWYSRSTTGSVIVRTNPPSGICHTYTRKTMECESKCELLMCLIHQFHYKNHTHFYYTIFWSRCDHIVIVRTPGNIKHRPLMAANQRMIRIYSSNLAAIIVQQSQRTHRHQTWTCTEEKKKWGTKLVELKTWIKRIHNNNNKYI